MSIYLSISMSMNLITSTLLCEYVCMSMPVYMNKKKAYIYIHHRRNIKKHIYIHHRRNIKKAYIYTPQKEYKQSIYIYTTEGLRSPLRPCTCDVTLGESEVSQTDVTIYIKQYIFRFEITIYNINRM